MPKVAQKDQVRDGVKAVVLALRMLEQLTFDPKPGRVTDLAKRLGTSKNRVHRHLQTLLDMGYVVRDVDTQRYTVGIRLVQLGSAAANHYDLLTVSRPVMRKLRDSLGLTVVLSRVVADQLYAIERIDGKSDVPVGVVIGSPLGLHSVLAFGSQGLLDAVAASDLEPRTSRTIVEPRRLRREIGAVRQQGWAAAPGETMDGLNAVAVPIVAAGGELIATLAVLGFGNELPAAPTPRHIAELEAAVREISSALFGTPNPGRKPVPSASNARTARK